MTEEKLKQLNQAYEELRLAKKYLSEISNENLDPITKKLWQTTGFKISSNIYRRDGMTLQLRLSDIYPLYLKKHREAQIKYQEAKEKFESL